MPPKPRDPAKPTKPAKPTSAKDRQAGDYIPPIVTEPKGGPVPKKPTNG